MFSGTIVINDDPQPHEKKPHEKKPRRDNRDDSTIGWDLMIAPLLSTEKVKLGFNELVCVYISKSIHF